MTNENFIDGYFSCFSNISLPSLLNRKNMNMSYHDKCIFSYKKLIALVDHFNKIVLMDIENPSNTTCRHKSIVHSCALKYGYSLRHVSLCDGNLPPGMPGDGPFKESLIIHLVTETMHEIKNWILSCYDNSVYKNSDRVHYIRVMDELEEVLGMLVLKKIVDKSSLFLLKDIRSIKAQCIFSNKKTISKVTW